MSPFRTAAQEELRPQVADTVRDAVQQMVRQFADPLAFLRELVQNSLDAGATRIDASVDFDESGGEQGKGRGLLRVRVVDDGEGMSLETVERCLLVLFRSSKDGDASKIGKFGVGFFSVFAVGPTEVLVDTGKGPEGLKVTLRPDYSYEVEQAAPRKGTAVTVKLALPREEVADFAQRCERALALWCPHVSVPLRFAAHRVPGVDPAERVLNRPFEPEGAVSLVHQEPDGSVLALALDPAGGARFYNRGILLHATEEPLVPGVSVRLESRHLGHTISRDNVRRDAHFERLARRARELALRNLRERYVSALRDAAERAGATLAAGNADPEHPHLAALRALFAAQLAAPFQLGPSELSLPLAHPLATPTGPRHAASPTEAQLYLLPGDPLAGLLAANRVPVFALDPIAGTRESLSWRTILLASRQGGMFAASSHVGAPCLLTPEQLEPAERALLEALRSSLRAVGIPAVGFGRFLGVCAQRLFLPLSAEQLERPNPALLLQPKELDAPLFALLGNRGVALDRLHPRVRAAVDVVPHSVALAATALARTVLLSARALDERRDRALFEHATALTVESKKR